MKTIGYLAAPVLLLLWPMTPPAWASDDGHGPDHWRVVDVAADDTLNIRVAPDAGSAKIGAIPHDADGLTNYGCIGQMSFGEWQKASAAEREAARKRRWCRIGYRRQIGWVTGWFLAEGDRAPGSNLSEGDELAPSEWGAVNFAENPVETVASILFRQGGAISGNTGCNRFTGTVTRDGRSVAIGPLGITKKMCQAGATRTETEMLRVLSQVREVIATFHVLAMFDAEGRLLATFRRRDWD